MKTCIIIGVSMEPTLHEGEIYHVKRVNSRTELRVGDIVCADVGNKLVAKRIKRIHRTIFGTVLYDLYGDNKKFSKNFELVFRSNIKYKLTRPTWLTRYIRRLKDVEQ